MKSDVKPIALYLPQFHPIKENDDWWGKGFTEWRNVAKARPKFKGHYQPHLPADLGFYDLRLNDVLIQQAALAKSYGIYGFCYYHYWFNGKLLLEQPIEQMLSSGKPDFPFCLCWANENWTRRWDGRNQDILITQNYALEDDRAHIKYLIPFFKDDRYIKIDGKPVYLMYRSELHPDCKAATEIWREEARKAGFEDLYLIKVENFEGNQAPEIHGFDAGMEFAPDGQYNGRKVSKKNIVSHVFKKMLHNMGICKNTLFENSIYSLKDLTHNMMHKKPMDYPYFRCVCPAWDNSARREKKATIYLDSTPENFKNWVSFARSYTEKNFRKEEQLFFINAWNEWAEGCHLEPDLKSGHAYLQAFKEGMEFT